MAGPNISAVRKPAVAGSFYPADAAECCRLAQQFVRPPDVKSFPGGLCGAIVPHAGWICSGAIAGQAIVAVASAAADVQVVVVFAAVHTPLPLAVAAMDSYATWSEPGAESAVAIEVRSELLGKEKWFAQNDQFHEREHAVEVVLPLIQAAWPNARVLPVQVPVAQNALEIGRATARVIASLGLGAVYLASSDLTHYGPAYQFAPAGVGRAGLAWAKENDQRLLQMVTAMTPETIVPEVVVRRNACGPGAIAAMMAACIEQGAKRASVLSHSSSFETLAAVRPQAPDNAVGYAAVVLGS